MTTVIALTTHEFGGANNIIQKAELSDLYVRTAFTVTFALSIAMGLGLYLMADAIGGWFKVEGVGAGVKIAALGFAVTPFSTIALALFRRDLMFGVIAVGNFVGSVAFAATSVVLALKGYSYLAPVWGQIAGSAAQALYFIWARRSLRIFAPSLEGHREVIHFGLYSSGLALINMVFNTAPQFLLARILGFGAVGLYSRAVTITQLFDRLVGQAIGPAVMPAVASQTRAGEDLKLIYLKSIALMSALQWPFLLSVAILARPLIELWLGPTWLDAAPLVGWLSAGSLALFAGYLTYPILVAAGHVRDALTSALISLPPSLMVMFASSFFGIEAVAASTLLTMPFQAAVSMFFICRRLDVEVAEIARALRKSALVATACGCAAAVGAAALQAGWLGPLASLAVGGVLVAFAWLAALAATDHPLLTEVVAACGGSIPSFGRAAASAPAPVVRPQRDKAEAGGPGMSKETDVNSAATRGSLTPTTSEPKIISLAEACRTPRPSSGAFNTGERRG
ncbi:O-antigen/teichoic acid export membrane protein [Rhodoblastus sphagnicola]|nr:O-antigen/teichoic acid export membrane protein [Rhodoblastus sphagnicola]